MKSRYLLATLALSAVFVFLSACTHRSSERGAEGAQVYTQGVGQRSGFYGADLPMPTTKAPNDQVYYFDFDQSEVYPEYVSSMEAQANYLAEHPRARIVLEGHTDERGSREYNIGLGERRVLSVRDVILAHPNVRRHQVRFVSYGQEKPVAVGHNESDYRLNRRVELKYEVKR